MSTLPGVASKGEKSKQKFQSLDINSLYRVSRGENLEKQQQKNTFTYKHGMQSLGKVPNARRAPANLPSLKSEHSGSDASVPLVPPGGPGWGKQDSTTGASSTSPTTTTTASTTTPTTPPTSSSSSTAQPLAAAAAPPPPQPPQLTPHQAAIALPVTTTVPPSVSTSANKHQHVQQASAAPAAADKSWSAVMSGPDPIHPPLYQSQQFQHEFPSLSVGDGGPTRTGSDAAPYAPGLSLRPQTEGSWIQGGSRPDGGPPRSSSVPLGAPPQLAAQVGLPQQPLPPQFRTVMPTFMFKGSFPAGSAGVPNQTPQMNNNSGSNSNTNNNHRRENNRQQQGPRMVDSEEITPRPIIKEEELSRMDEIDKDMGWTCHDEIDYNQKLAFSDDESSSNEKQTRREKMMHSHSHSQSLEKTENNSHYHHHHHQNEVAPQSRGWSTNPNSNPNSNSNLNPNQGQPQRQQQQQRPSDEEVWKQRRSQHNKNLELTVLRAKQRKEEEEKRFNEATKQGAAKKLMELEEKMNKRSREEEGAGTINPSVVPAKPIVPADIPLPDFQREREKERSRTPNENEEKPRERERDRENSSSSSSFRQMTQIEGKNFAPPRAGSKQQQQQQQHKSGERERDREIREQNGPSFSRHFQNQLPPRFQKQRNNSSGGGGQFQHSSASSGGVESSNGGRWMQQQESPERERDEERDFKRQSSEDSHRSSSHKSERFNDEVHEYASNRHDYEYAATRRSNRESDKEKEKEKEDWHGAERYRDRPQRPDSRDSRHSRDSAEPREFGAWTDGGAPGSGLEPTYEEKRKDHGGGRVPGPITKDRIEADDLRSGEKRNLTQLKRGQLPEKKAEKKESEKSIQEEMFGGKRERERESEVVVDTKSWADQSSEDVFEKSSKNDGKESGSEFKEKSQTRPRNYQQSGKGWGGGGGGGEYHRSGWPKRQPAQRGGQRQFHTDSEGSVDEVHSGGDLLAQKSAANKDIKHEKNAAAASIGSKIEKDGVSSSTKRESYVPRGEPSRHGRGGGGGGNFRGGGGGSGRGGLSKRIDGYGPPPSKSPFGHHDEKKSSDENSNEAGCAGALPLPLGGFDDRAKLNQQALSAGIARKEYEKKGRVKQVERRGKSKTKDDVADSNSDNSDDRDGKTIRKPGALPPSSFSTIKASGVRPASQGSNSGSARRTNPAPPPPRLSSDKKTYRDLRETIPRQNSSGTLRNSNKKDEKSEPFVNVLADVSARNKENDGGIEEGEEKASLCGDSDGFQEVKSKKTGKERGVKSLEEMKSSTAKPLLGPVSKLEKDVKALSSKPKPSSCSSGNNGGGVQLTQQQISNIPPLMATPVNPPPVLPQMSSQSKAQFERPRQNKLAPRFAKQREVNRLQKVQMQQQQNVCDVNDMNKVNQSLNVYAISKDSASVVPPALANVWEKTASSSSAGGGLGIDASILVGNPVAVVSEKTLLDGAAAGGSNSPSSDKVLGGGKEKTMLDGTTPPMNTIIFENTNFKSAPGARNPAKPQRVKLDDAGLGDVGGFTSKPLDLLCKSDKQSDSIQIALPFKEDTSDIKLDFFASELSHLTDEKSTSSSSASKNLCMPRSMHVDNSSSSSTISTADALNFKIQSVKKMWETPAPVDHAVSEDTSTFPSSFSDANALDPSAFKGNDTHAHTPEDTHEYAPPNQVGAANNTTNVCKVKPTQQVSGGGGGGGGGGAVQAVHQQHAGMGGLMGNPLSPPPPLPAVQYTANQHLSYQAGLGGSNQYGISAIPSPPTVMYNSTQQLQQTAAGLYGAFQIDQSGVLGGQARSQYSQYYGLGQTASSPYSTQSVYLQTQPHPPSAQAPPPDLYQNINNYRMSASGPFGQNQQLSNPTTVLISSTSNSLMSASVKPSGQQISAIGTKAGGVGQAYQQQSQQSQQVYMYEPSLQANYMPSAAGVMQRGPPTGPVQNNVVPALQPSSSYYSGSTGQTGYFQQPGSSTLQSAQLQQHQAGYGLQGNVFGTHNQSHTNAGLQSFNSHFLSTPIQIAAALNHQQYRTQQQYMKGQQQQMNEQSGRSQQLKSPSSQEVLCSVFNSGSQISSPKLRQNCKQPPPQPSPTAQHKYNLYQSVGSQQSANMQRYPTPIQRPINFQVNLGALQQQQQQNSSNNSNNNQKQQQHRANNNNNANSKVPSRQYYQSNSISSSQQNEKIDDTSNNHHHHHHHHHHHSKLSNDGTNSTNNSTVANSNKIGGGGVGGGGPTGTGSSATAAVEKEKDAINIEETSALKD